MTKPDLIETVLWTSSDILAITNGRVLHIDLPDYITGVSIDPQKVQMGDAFFAVKTNEQDGHKYLNAAMRAGAAFAVVAEGKLPALGALQMPFVVVPDVGVALQQLAIAGRERSRAKIVALAGGTGENAITQALSHVLSQFGVAQTTQVTEREFEIPLALAGMADDTQFAVFQVPTKHLEGQAGSIDLVKPHVALLPNINQIENFKSSAGRLFQALVKGGTVIVQGDLRETKSVVELANNEKAGSVLTYGAGGQNHTKLTSQALSATGSQFSALISGGAVDVTLKSPGRHRIHNVLGVLTVCDLFGVDLGEAARLVSQMNTQNGQGELINLRVGTGNVTLLDESADANVIALESAIEVLANANSGENGRRIAVIGDTDLAGEKSNQIYKRLADLVGKNNIDLVFTAGDGMQFLHDGLPDSMRGAHVNNADTLTSMLTSALRGGDVVSVVAGADMKFDVLVKALKEKFKRA